MKAANTRLAAVLASLLAIAAVWVLMSSRLINVGVQSSDQTAAAKQSGATLPAGACPLSTANLPIAQATRMEAKLVTSDTAAASDSDFPWRMSASATEARTQGQSDAPRYVWVIAGAGNFHFAFPRPPEAGNTAGTFSDLVYYIPADTCGIEGGYDVRGMEAWPTWFDAMVALSDTKIK